MVLLLAACAMPAGSEVEACDGTWRDVESRAVTPGAERPQVVPIACMRQVDDRRVRIGFMLPPGPSCHRLSSVDVVESADAVSITLSVSPDDNPAAGACPEQPMRVATEIDVQAAVAERTLLDGSAK